jgi:hypothetical protein
MLSEVKSSHSRERAWFHSVDGDLYVSRGPGGGVAAFELACLHAGAAGRREVWAEWTEKGGLRAGLVDSKETGDRGHDMMSPLVNLSGAAGAEAVPVLLAFLRRQGEGVPEAWRSFIEERLARADHGA